MTAAQIVVVVSWSSVIVAPWVAWFTETSLRSPHFVAVVATAVLVGLVAGMHHDGQVAIARRETLMAVERQREQALRAREVEARSLLVELRGHVKALERAAARLPQSAPSTTAAGGDRPNVRGPYIRRRAGGNGEPPC